MAKSKKYTFKKKCSSCENNLIFKHKEVLDVVKDLNLECSKCRNLEVGFAKTGFMGTIGERAQELNFEKVKEVTYIQVLKTSVAQAKLNNN